MLPHSLTKMNAVDEEGGYMHDKQMSKRRSPMLEMSRKRHSLSSTLFARGEGVRDRPRQARLPQGWMIARARQGAAHRARLQRHPVTLQDAGVPPFLRRCDLFARVRLGVHKTHAVRRLDELFEEEDAHLRTRTFD
eukprot:6410403-Prymnesium_polylepis.2